jgi:hypothetical protein
MGPKTMNQKFLNRRTTIWGRHGVMHDWCYKAVAAGEPYNLETLLARVRVLVANSRYDQVINSFYDG